jgi:hypothetical protein
LGGLVLLEGKAAGDFGDLLGFGVELFRLLFAFDFIGLPDSGGEG